MATFFAILFALAASFGLAWLYALVLYWADRHEKEPKRLLLGMFLWGSMVAIPASLIFSLTLDAGIAAVVQAPSAQEYLTLSLTAPLVEESTKGLALLLLFLFAAHEVDSLFDGIVYAALVGLGFEALENALYLIGAWAQGGAGDYLTLLVLRLGLFGFTHAFFTSLTGLGLTVAHLYARRRWSWLAVPVGWLAAVLAHSWHNAMLATRSAWCLLSVLADWTGLFALLGIAWWALRREARWLREHLAAEVAEGLITPAQYHTACAPARRAQAIRQARRAGEGPATAAFYARLAKLAFLKAQAARNGLTPQRAQRLAQLRQEIAQLAAKAKTA